MTDMLTRSAVQAQLAQARIDLEAVLRTHTAERLAQTSATSVWSALDLLRHIEVWAELAERCLRDWHGSRDWILTFASEDQFNQEMVAMRADWSLERIAAAIAQAYQFYEETLATCSDAELAEEDAAPWGQQLSRLQQIMASLSHDRTHLDQLEAALRVGN